MGKNFFQEWRGDFPNPFAKNQWVRAEGSSLEKEEPKILANGGIVVHPKCSGAVKVFAKEADGCLWSIIVPSTKLSSLKKDLHEAGFVTS